MTRGSNPPPFYLVWCPDGREPRYRHESEALARTEAERLARNNPGLEFYVLTPTSRTVRQEVITERYALDDIPF